MNANTLFGFENVMKVSTWYLLSVKQILRYKSEFGTLKVCWRPTLRSEVLSKIQFILLRVLKHHKEQLPVMKYNYLFENS